MKGASSLDAKYQGIELEAGNSQIVRDGQLIESAPDPRNGLEGQSRHDLDLPAISISIGVKVRVREEDMGPGERSN